MNKERILIVVDPSAESHPAIERGMLLAAAMGMCVELFVCDYNAGLVGSAFLNAERLKAAKAKYLRDQQKMLEDLAGPYRQQGIEVVVKVAWDRPLHEGILRQVLHTDPRFVIKDTHQHSLLSRTLFTNTDWHLIQDCPAPLWLVRSNRDFAGPAKILAAVDPLHEHDKPASLDTRLATEAYAIADALEGQVHLVHVFNPYLNPDDPDKIEQAHETTLLEFADRLQVPRDRTHLHAGHPVDLLPKVVQEIDADLIVMGSIARSRLENAIVGSTAEKVLDQLTCDVLVIKPQGFVCPVTFKSVPHGAVFAD